MPFIPEDQMPSQTTPRRGFIPEDQMDQQSQPSSGILSEIANSSPVTAINALGGLAGRALGYGAADIINTPVMAANYLNKKLAGLFGVKPENVPTPDLFNPQSFSMPGVSQKSQNFLDPLARDITTGAELLSPIKDFTTFAGKNIASKLSDLTGFNADSKATDFVKALISDQPSIKSQFKKSYGAVESQANARGYDGTQKIIDTPLFSNSLSNMSDKEREALFNNLSGDAKNSITTFMNDPSYKNAHDLQSILGTESFNLRKSSDGLDRYIGGQIANTRKNLNNDIHNTFDANGDNDLSQQRQDITQQYAENENRLLMADKLKSGIQNFPDEGIQTNAKKIVNAYSKAGFKGLLGKFDPLTKTDAMNASIADIKNSLDKQETTKWLLNKLKYPGIGVGIGLGGLGVGYGVHEIAQDLGE